MNIKKEDKKAIDLISANLQAMGANPTTTDKNGQTVIKVNAPAWDNVLTDNKIEEEQTMQYLKNEKTNDSKYDKYADYTNKRIKSFIGSCNALILYWCANGYIVNGKLVANGAKKKMEGIKNESKTN